VQISINYYALTAYTGALPIKTIRSLPAIPLCLKLKGIIKLTSDHLMIKLEMLRNPKPKFMRTKELSKLKAHIFCNK